MKTFIKPQTVSKLHFEIFSTDQKSIDAIKNGYSFSTFKALAQEMAIPLKELAIAAGIASTTLHRREIQEKI
jgi:hypothetical protein